MSELWDSICHFSAIKPNDIAIIGNDQLVSWKQLKQRVRTVAATLDYFSGQVLALYADNSPDWIIIDLACQLANITLLPLPSFFSEQQLNHAIKQSGAVAIILAASDTEASGKLSMHLGKQTELSSVHSSLVICDTANHDTIPLPQHTQKITFTSGSTGQPKGVCLSYLSQINTSRSLLSATGLESIRHIAILPFSTLLENIAGIYAPLLSGGQIIALPQNLLGFNGSQDFDLTTLLKAISTYQPSSFILLPELLTATLGAIGRGWSVPNSIDFIAVGGSKVSQHLLQAAQLAGLPVYQGYGLSECASVVSLNNAKHSNVETTGRVLDHLKVVIEQGEIVVLGNAFLGYINQEETWYQDKVYTGDLGSLDAQGCLHITGRKKNVLVSSFGRNISPEWVESELLSNGLLSQCVVFGDAEPFCIALVTARNDEICEQDIDQWVAQVNQGLPDYAQVQAWQILPSPMTVKAGLITTNGRPVRHKINQTYQDIIQRLYQRDHYAVL
jgi:long-subunit acyl-CoA synthetase (AMP-forming)